MEKLQDSSAFLMQNMQENWRLSREAEEKRSLLATINLFLATALQITIVFTGFHLQILPLACWLIFIGLYGIIAGLKLYERSQFHIMRARKLRAKLDSMYLDAELEQVFQEAEQAHKLAYPFLMRIRLNTIWTLLHTLIALLGIIYFILCLLLR
ncbi:MAG TPA: hypothetical protein VFU49_22990 [Ktedonobacteraceae bacterium]|nr:hypothetical protein [Ktedonobacteraceae bacterium]